MTQPPEQPPPDQPSQDDEDEQSLVPALLVVFALYLLWRGSHEGFRGSTASVERALNLRGTIGGALAALASRALGRQRQLAGRAGDELWAHAPAAVQAGVDAGITALAEALLWSDRHGGPSPTTADHGRPGTTVPTQSKPPDFLARLVAGATVNAAQTSAAVAAGWRTKTWQTRRDNRVRDAHVLLQGQQRPLGEPFVTGGHKLQYPHDPAAPIELRANCRCWLHFGR